jgi:chemosensory pili system protein ChpC
MSNNSAVRCILIPFGSGQLLLPTAVIAEVTSYKEPEQLDNDQPDWLLGIINWRKQRIPLISIEKTLSLPMIHPVNKIRTIVLYGLKSPHTMAFYAFQTIDVPRTIAAVTKSNLINNPKVEKNIGLLFNVKVHQADTAWLPDLNYLEENLLNNVLNV